MSSNKSLYDLKLEKEKMASQICSERSFLLDIFEFWSYWWLFLIAYVMKNFTKHLHR